MAVACLLLLFFVCSLEQVHSQQTFPYLSFMGQALVNHSYVDLSLVGDHYDGGDGIQCHTDLRTCCTGTQGVYRGDWYFPNGIRLPFPTGYVYIYENREAERVGIHRRNSATSPTGLYRCNIPTNDVHDDDDISVRATVYVGLYTASGGML